MDIDTLTNDLMRLRNALRETGRDAADQIDAAQSEADRNGAMLAERLEHISLAEAEELDRHADAMADLRRDRDQALADHGAAGADLSARIRTVAKGFIPARPAPAAIAAE